MRYKIPGLQSHYPDAPENDIIRRCGNQIKYDDNWPLLFKGWAREGLTDKQIYERIRISADTFYLRLKQFPELLQALREGRKPVNVLAEDTIIKAFTGYDYTEETREGEVTTNEDGTEIFTTVKKKVTRKHEKPNWNAAAYWLERRDKTKHWVLPKDGGNNDFINKDLEIIVQDI